MLGLFEHGGEPENLALCWFVDHDLLMIFIDSRDPDHPRHQDVSPSAHVANLPYPLPWREVLHFNLCGKNRGFIVVEQRKERNLPENFGIARHSGSPSIERCRPPEDHNQKSEFSVPGSQFSVKMTREFTEN